MAVLLQAKAVAFSIGGVERGDQDGLGVGTGWNGAKRMSGGQAPPRAVDTHSQQQASCFVEP
jgi:hypothetical protein